MTDHTKTAHATCADIEAILEARRTATITVDKIPVRPQAAPAPAPQPITAESLARPATLPSTVQAPAPQVSDSDVADFLGAHLPGLIGATVALATPPFNFMEVVALGQAVSAAVAAGLPQVKGTEARVLVTVTSRYLWRTYAVPRLPDTVRPFAGLLETLLITGIEAAYQLAVKPKK